MTPYVGHGSAWQMLYFVMVQQPSKLKDILLLALKRNGGPNASLPK